MKLVNARLTVRLAEGDLASPSNRIAVGRPALLGVAVSAPSSAISATVIVRKPDTTKFPLELLRTGTEELFSGSFPAYDVGTTVEYSVLVEARGPLELLTIDSADYPGGILRYTVVAADTSTRVAGTLILEHGERAANLSIALKARGFGGKLQTLAESTTNDRGEYALSYEPSAAAHASFEVWATSPDSHQVRLSAGKKTLPTSDFNLVAPAAFKPFVSEFARLHAAVAPALDGKPERLKEALERDERRDISLLAASTGWDGRALALAAEAHAQADATQIPAAALYALYRVGLPAEPELLAGMAPRSVDVALASAVASGIIGADERVSGLRAFEQFRAVTKLSRKAPGALSSLGEMADRAPIEAADRELFKQALVAAEPEAVWSDAKRRGMSEAAAGTLSAQGKLAYLTMDNGSLTSELLSRLQAGDPRELIEQGFHQATEWQTLLSAIATRENVDVAQLIPPAFEGAETAERLTAYTEELARGVRRMDPQLVTRTRIDQQQLNGLDPELRGGIARFLRRASERGYRLGETPLVGFVKQHGAETLFDDMTPETRALSVEEAKRLHRLYALSPDDETLETLLALGFRSSSDIARMSLSGFTQLFAASTPEQKTKATRVYWKAQQVSSTVFSVFSGAKQLASSPAIAVISGDQAARASQLVAAQAALSERFPTLEALFGSVDYCECQHCSSVLSPAAYLVDILRFLDPKESDWAAQQQYWQLHNGGNQSYTEAGYRKPYEVLDGRRPDLARIVLSCENTHTALPHIDIAIEIMECLLASDSAQIKPFDTGSARSEDLIAEPQHVDWTVYEITTADNGKLLRAVYPMLLPFDLALETVRALLSRLGVPLWTLRELVGRPQRLDPQPGTRAGLRETWLERIALGPRDADALQLRETTWYALYGYESAPAALAALTGAAGARTLARRLGVTYKELVELVLTSFVNPEIDQLLVLKRLQIDPHDLESYYAGTLGFSEQDLLARRIAALGEGAAEKLRALWSDEMRERLAVLRTRAGSCSFEDTQLALSKQPSSLEEASRRLALILLRMHTFVRLQRKLGWTTQALDSALRVLFPALGPDGVPVENAWRDATTLNFDPDGSLNGAWSHAMGTALVYLSHVQELRARSQAKLEVEQLLTLWSSIETRGTSSLYERLFLGASADSRDPAFDSPFGDYLQTSARLHDHLDAVRQACGMSAEQVVDVLGPDTAIPLTLANVSRLYRHGVLASMLGIEVSALVSLLAVSARDPFAPLAAGVLTSSEQDAPWTETLGFVREVELIKEAGLSVDTLVALCTGSAGSLDAQARSASVDRALLALSALPVHEETPIDPAKPRASEEQRVERDRAKARAMQVQALAAALAAPEPLVTRLALNVLGEASPTDGQRLTLLAGGLSIRALPITASLGEARTSWRFALWFPSAGTYQLGGPAGAALLPETRVRFGLAGSLSLFVTSPDGFVRLEGVRAGTRYELELTLPGALALQLVGPSVPLAVELAAYERFAMALSRLQMSLDLLDELKLDLSALDFANGRAGALDLNDLPGDAMRARATYERLVPWLEFAALRRQSKAGDRVTDVLRAARVQHHEAGHSASLDRSLGEAISALTGWPAAYVAAARVALSLGTNEQTVAGGYLVEAPDFASARALRSSLAAMRTIKQLGVAPETAVALASSALGRAQATRLRHAVKARFGASSWNGVARPIFDALRKKKRDALVAYLIHLPEAPFGASLEELYEYLLLDPGVEPPVLASRIQLATASVQLFIQRVLLNFESRAGGVPPDMLDGKRWAWMRLYRVWEANRKIFLWPENWLLPELRDGVSHLFTESLNMSLEGDITEDSVRSALHLYLQGLLSIARLEMMTMYLEPGRTADGSVLHVVGRTQQLPRKFFYRKLAHGLWTPWQPLGVEVESEHLALAFWRGRLTLFWVSFLEQAQQKASVANEAPSDLADSSVEALSAETTIQLQLHWLELVEDKWRNRSSTSDYVTVESFQRLRANTAEARAMFSIHVRADAEHSGGAGNEGIEIHIRHPEDSTGHCFLLFSKLAPPLQHASSSRPPQPVFSAVMATSSKFASAHGSPRALRVRFADSSSDQPHKLDQLLERALGGEGPGVGVLEAPHSFALLFPTNEVRAPSQQALPSSRGTPSGYAVRAQQAHHLTYRGTDGAIHDLWRPYRGELYYDNLTSATEAYAATGDPHGYAVEEQTAHAVAYAAELRLVELVWSRLEGADPSAGDAAGWRMDVLYRAESAADAPVGRPLGGLFVPNRGVAYQLANGQIVTSVQDRESRAWRTTNLTRELDLPLASSEPTGFVVLETRAGRQRVVSRHLFFVDEGQNVHELRSDGAGAVWQRHNLTELTSAPRPAANARLSAYHFAFQQTLHVVYRDEEGVVQELWGPGTAWNHAALGAPFGRCLGDPQGYTTEPSGLQHVVYRGVDGHIHELWYNGSWQENILSLTVAGALPAQGDPAGYAVDEQGAQFVSYRDHTGELRELAWTRAGWTSNNYPRVEPWARQNDPGTLVAPFFYESRTRPHTFFVEPFLIERTAHEWTQYGSSGADAASAQVAPHQTRAIEPRAADELVLHLAEERVLDFIPGMYDRILASDTLVKTPRGVFGMSGGVVLDAKSSGQVRAVVDLKTGTQTIDFRTNRVMRGSK